MAEEVIRAPARDGAPAARRAVTAAVIGNLMEWYDFAVYGYFATLIGILFFPAEDPATSLLLTFATFGVGFVMRPIGALVIGAYGDRAGRKSALVLTVMLMAVGTVMIGVLPTHGDIGVLAPILLVVARLIQGFSAGGEWGGATAFIVEYAPENRRGFFGSWQQFSVGGGLLLGSLTGATLTGFMSPEDLEGWGWRIPFLLGVLIGPVGLYLRTRVDETPRYEAATRAAQVTRAPFFEMLRAHRKAVLLGMGLTVLWTVSYYIFLAYMPTYVTRELNLPASSALFANSLALVVFIALTPVTGALSDRIGRKPLMIASSLGFAILTYPAFLFLSAVPALWAVIAVQILFAVLIALFSGPAPAALSELYPTKVRYTSLSTGYNLSVTIFGGFAPFIATWLIAVTGSSIAPAIYVVAAAAVTLLVLAAIRETFRAPLR